MNRRKVLIAITSVFTILFSLKIVCFGLNITFRNFLKENPLLDFIVSRLSANNPDDLKTSLFMAIIGVMGLFVAIFVFKKEETEKKNKQNFIKKHFK